MKLKYSNNCKTLVTIKFAFNISGIPENNDNLEGVYLKRPDFELL